MSHYERRLECREAAFGLLFASAHRVCIVNLHLNHCTIATRNTPNCALFGVAFNVTLLCARSEEAARPFPTKRIESGERMRL